MTGLETTILIALWIMVFALLVLVLGLYHLVDKAYSAGAASAVAAAIPIGAPFPKVDVITNGVVDALVAREDEIELVVFAKTGCSGCERLGRALSAYGGNATVLLIEGARFPEDAGVTLPDNVRTFALASPGDSVREAGVVTVPLIYAVRGGKVLASGSSTNLSGINELMDDAAKYQVDPPPVEIPVRVR
jgi:hypothetical protein